MIVLRNREDVRGPSGKLEPLLGRRADRYDRSGKQIATAMFPKAVQWIAFPTSTTIGGVTKNGETFIVKWAAPRAGEILDP